MSADFVRRAFASAVTLTLIVLIALAVLVLIGDWQATERGVMG